MGDFNCLDTNAALRLMLQDVPDQHRKISRLISKSDRKFIIPDIVFFEINFTLVKSYGFARENVAEFITKLMAIPNIVCDKAIIAATVRKYTKHPKLSFADCYLTEYARVKRCEPLWTFDRKLATQSGTAKEIK